MDDALERNRMLDAVSVGVLTIPDVRLAMAERREERRQSVAASAVAVSSSSAAAAPAAAAAAASASAATAPASAAAEPAAQDSWAVSVPTPKPRTLRKTHKDKKRERGALDKEAQEKLIAEILADPAKFVASTEQEIEQLPNARKLGGTTKRFLPYMTARAKLITPAMDSASKTGLAMDLIAAARDAKREASAAIEAIEAEEARLAAIEAVQESFLAGDKLLIGAITTVKRGLAEPLSEEAFRKALQAVYVKQCTVTRLNWMLHLGINGTNTDGPPNGTHFTKYNNALVSDVDLGSWRVDLHSVAETAAKLFESVPTVLQIHATTVGADGTRYHKYWDGTYSATADPPYDRTALDAEYDRMYQYMLTRVTSAKTSHGRVGGNDRGQELFT